MKKQISISILLVILSAILASACGSDDPLVGKWEFSSGDGTYFFWRSDEIEFKADNTIINHEDDESGTWSKAGSDRLTVRSDGTVYEFTYQVSGDRLTITDEDGDRGVFQKIR